MGSDADWGTKSVPSATIAPPYLDGPELGEDRLVGEVLAVDELSQQDREVWRLFLSHQPAAFLSYPYVCAFASHYPLVRVARISAPDGRTVAFFPFQYRSRAFAMAGIGERLGGDLSDYFGIIAEQGFRIKPQTLLQLSGLKSLFYSQLDENQKNKGLVGDKALKGFRIDFPDGGEAYWGDKRRDDKKFVSDTERRERNMMREYGSLRFEFSENNSAAALDKVISEKRAQYRRTYVGDVLSCERVRAVLHILCRTRDVQCSGIVSTLYAGDTWIASHFGLRCGSMLHYWFPVYNPALKALAPGRILLKQIILGAQINGLKCIDRGGGDSMAKRDFATSQHFFYSGLWQRPGPAAIAHRIGLAIDWRIARFFGRASSE